MVLHVRAELVASCFRASDFVCRTGHSTVTVLLPNCVEQQALAGADRVEQELAKLTQETGRQPMKMAVGVAAISESTSSDDLLEQAQRALVIAREARTVIAASQLQGAALLVECN